MSDILTRGLPIELVRMINARRAVFGDTRMTASSSEGSEGTSEGQTTDTPDDASGDDAEDATDDDKDLDLEGLRKELAKVRRENAAARVKAKEAADTAETSRNDFVQQMGKALGLIKEDEQVDSSVLNQRITDAEAKARDKDAALLVWQNADTLKVDPAALVDSRAFGAAIATLDPNSDTFADDVMKAAQAAVKSNPRLQATQAVTKGGATFTGGTGEQRSKAPVSLETAVNAVYSK